MERFTLCALIGLSALWVNADAISAPLADAPDSNAAALFGQPIPDESLSGLRGGHFYESNTNSLDAQLYDNTATSIVTGSNTVTQGAFSGTNGFATVVQNSGNNVIIQNATILNLKLQ